MKKVSGFDVTEEQKQFLEWVSKTSLISNAAYFRAKIEHDINKLRKANQCGKCSLPEWSCQCGR